MVDRPPLVHSSDDPKRYPYDYGDYDGYERQLGRGREKMLEVEQHGAP